MTADGNPMSSRGSAFSRAAGRAKQAEPPPGAHPGSAPLETRLQKIEQARQVVRTTTLRVPPEQCRLWPKHNRNFERLNETNCRDLIDSFISAGKQEIPAIVRRVAGEEPVRYEIICGARRYWTVRWLRENNYPQFTYLIEVRDLTDEEAFRISNLENLDRRDISDYERAIDYQQALNDYYQGVQRTMAERLNKSTTWLSRYLKLAQLPTAIPNAYAQWRDLKLHHAPDLLALLSDPVRAPAVLERAAELRAAHAHTAGRRMTGAEVFKQLKAAAPAPSRRTGPVKSYGPAEQPHLHVQHANRYGLRLFVPRKSGASVDELRRSFDACLKDYYSPPK